MNNDLVRLEKSGLIKIKSEKWEDESKIERTSKRIMLTAKGAAAANEVYQKLPEPFKESALKVKERLYPKSPDAVRHLVHREFPEYRNTYAKNDIE